MRYETTSNPKRNDNDMIGFLGVGEFPIAEKGVSAFQH